jgi:phage tail protein X
MRTQLELHGQVRPWPGDQRAQHPQQEPVSRSLHAAVDPQECRCEEVLHLRGHSRTRPGHGDTEIDTLTRRCARNAQASNAAVMSANKGLAPGGPAPLSTLAEQGLLAV